MLVPKLVTTLRGYNRAQLLADLTAGVIVGIVALPLAIAFAIASGVTPERGLYTAIVAGFIISALGGSRVQIGGPTGAFVITTYSVLHGFGPAGLLLCTMMAGAMLGAMGGLFCLPGGEDFDGLGRQWQDADTPLALRRFHHLPRSLQIDRRLTDGHGGAGEVEMVPFEPDQLPTTRARGEGEHHQRAEHCLVAIQRRHHPG